MALKGTLKDFGIADIFQLIGHQAKTGTLVLKNNEKEVSITFKEGNVVRAESTTREKRELLGAMLMRAEVISQQQLDQALDLQRRTLKRLGDIMVDAGFMTADALREFTKLQTTETIYKLFLWSNGTYEFTQAELKDIQQEPFEAIRSESVLMEGFRMVDEWPIIRKKVTSYGMTFRIIRQVGGSAAGGGKKAAGGGDALDNLDAAFDAMEGGSNAAPAEDDDKIDANERLVFGLVQPGRDVQKLIDLSRLGEFETCKSLLNLINGGYLEGIPAALRPGSGMAEGGALEPKQTRLGRLARVQQVTGWVLGGAAVVGLLWALELSPRNLRRSDRLNGVPPEAFRQALGDGSLARVQRALEVFRLRTGHYPDHLEQLVERGLLEQGDLHRPYERSFAYMRNGERYTLVRPYY
jgi:hypothetical protein